MTRRAIIAEAIHEANTIAYKRATPSADYDELVDKALKGDKKIDFNSYELPLEDFLEIEDQIAEKYKLSKYEKRIFNFHFYLGHSPRTAPSKEVRDFKL